MSKNVIAIIQARASSSRYPGKIYENINGLTMLEHIIARVSLSELVDDIVVATTTEACDDRISRILSDNTYIYRGDKNNVLKRFYNAAIKMNASVIVRITADDPFKDCRIIDECVSQLLEKKLDYCSNTIKPTYPEGVDVEVFTMDALAIMYKNAQTSVQREHVTQYILQNKNMFSVYNIEAPIDFSHYRWTVDYPADMIFVREVYKRLYKNRYFSYLDVLDLVNNDKKINALMLNVKRNEGLLKSQEQLVVK